MFVLGIAIPVCGNLKTAGHRNNGLSFNIKDGSRKSMLPIIFIGMLELHISTWRFLVAVQNPILIIFFFRLFVHTELEKDTPAVP
jgi:hypothetical protein